MNSIRRHADAAFLVLVVLVIGGLNLFWTTHDIAANNHKFCAVVTGLTSPVPQPGDPAANPSREHLYLTYLKAVRLAHDLGCGKGN